MVKLTGIPLKSGEAVHLKGVNNSFLHDQIESKAIVDYIFARVRFCRVALFLFSQGPNVGFWACFRKIGHINWRINPVKGIKLENRIIR